MKDYIVREFGSSIMRILPRDLSSVFSVGEKVALFLRAIRGYKIFFIKHNNRVIAYCFLKKNYLKKYPFLKKNDWLINPYFTIEEYRGRGIGTYLIKNVLNMVNCHGVYALVLTDNLPSIRVLEKCGFNRIGYSKKRYWSHHLSKEDSEIAIYKYNAGSCGRGGPLFKTSKKSN